MISIEQIKAARALLDWTQDDLANAAGLSKPAVNTLERRISSPKKSTLDSIQKAFEKAGVEFTDGPGVRLKSSVLKTHIYEGEDSLLRLVHDIFETLKDTDKTLMICGVEEQKFKDVGGPNIIGEVEKRIKHGIRTKILSCEGDTNFLEPREHYRWMPRKFFPKTPYYIYDNKYAIFLWGPPKKVVVIENAEIAQTFREQFQALWDVSNPPGNS